ncbi:MAG: hypothetical protein K6T70_12805 [Meiothermus ruber]|uniref:hypothetical protein n=1 Tax=Meiothermus ruber TaxID=277 RepID=UPI0023F75355|nr:hypothetical protein [Meiothermus ruber]MCL6530974.1 hypothetical protein [Meiothermus ruber]
MRSLLAKLLPLADKGILSKTENSTLILSGFRNDIDPEALQAEIEAEWLELARQEAANRIKNALIAASERLRPDDFTDLMTKLQLGRIADSERQTLNAYYDALDALEREAKALLQKLEKAESVEVVNKIPWPEWVGWEPLPLRFELEVEQTYPEASNK